MVYNDISYYYKFNCSIITIILFNNYDYFLTENKNKIYLNLDYFQILEIVLLIQVVLYLILVLILDDHLIHLLFLII